MGSRPDDDGHNVRLNGADRIPGIEHQRLLVDRS
jgi:hypothetical protein